MKKKCRSLWLQIACVVAAFGAFVLDAEATGWGPPHRSSAGVIIEWNQLTQTSLAGLPPPGLPPFAQTRIYAMVHVAMADAVVAIEGKYDPFHVRVWAPHGASAEAAAAQAARDVLVNLSSLSLSSEAEATLDAALSARLATIPPGPRGLGVQVGQKVAAAVLSWRAGDGFANANPQPPPLFLTSTLPGIWRPTGSGTGGTFAKLGDVEPFGLITPSQFLPAQFPQLETAQYATDYNEVKDDGERPAGYPAPMGGFNEQQQIALIWAGGAGTAHANVTNPFRLWSNVARDIARDERLSLAQTARLFALMTTSIHDSVQTSHASKFTYMLWRPETAIAHADVDNNADTDAQPGWVPLLTTPPYPSHSSNMQCIGAGAARTLRNVFRGERSFIATWYESDTITPPSTTPPVERMKAFGSFWEMAVEEGNSRIWGGIHFRFELDTSLVACSDVADYIYDNYMLPKSHGW